MTRPLITDVTHTLVFLIISKISLNEAHPNIKIYYTRTYSSSDKAECEKNHVIVRYINPKGDSWDNLTQDDVNKMFSHINSYPRESLEKKTPYQVSLKKFGKEFLESVGIYEVDKKEVVLTPDLLKKKK